VSTVAAVRMNVFRANHQLTVHIVSYVNAVAGLSSVKVVGDPTYNVITMPMPILLWD